MNEADHPASERVRRATCRSGQLSATCTGEPVRVSVCHCFACQHRSGSAFAWQARWPAERVTIAGDWREWERLTDSGNLTRYRFCPICGTTVCYMGGPLPEMIAVPVGGFLDPDFPAPRFSVWEERRRDWVVIAGDDIEHIA